MHLTPDGCVAIRFKMRLNRGKMPLPPIAMENEGDKRRPSEITVGVAFSHEYLRSAFKL
jgi:hypothetical protein